MDYGLRSVLEGLLLIAVDNQQQLYLLARPEFSQDEYFDYEALDYLPYQVEIGVIPKRTADRIKELYREADKILSAFNWSQEDEFFKSNNAVVKKWRDTARSLLFEIESHNNSLVWDGFATLRHPTA